MTTKSKATEAALAGEEMPEGVTIGETKVELSKVKQVIRYVSSVPDPQADRYSVEEVDGYVSHWILQGYELFNTHYLGEVTDTVTNTKAFGFMYVLTLKE